MTKRIWIGIVMALCMALCTGCKPSQMQAAKASEEKEIGLKVQVLNYMDEGLGVVYVKAGPLVAPRIERPRRHVREAVPEAMREIGVVSVVDQRVDVQRRQC